jgi:hypothetical protein
MKERCDTCNNQLTEEEMRFYEGLPGEEGLLGEVLCDTCANGSATDSMESGFLGWSPPEKKAER